MEEFIYTYTPKPPYRFTPHLERFSIPGEPTPHIYIPSTRTFRRLFNLEGELVAVKAQFHGEPDAPVIDLTLYARNHNSAVMARGLALESFRADFDYKEFLEKVMHIKPLYRLALKYEGLRPGRATSLYEALVDSIVKQRLPLRVSLKIMGRLMRSYGHQMVIGGEEYYSFPGPRRIISAGVEGLRSHSLTRLKAGAIVEVAERELEGSLPTVEEAVNDPEGTIRELTRIRGVGRWTAELSIAMVHPRFPIGPLSDLAVSRGLRAVLGGEPRPGEVVKELGDYAGLVMYLAAYEYEERRVRAR
ncbi:MAG: hypothetical protein F7C35_03245 [Desulfurococcales archaeon]|nr:hypothetical protein [Desulfurococcales archaeon]